ncbi:MAG: hypothetical protein ACYDC2_07930 [Solirubrobacteraceae bacterium]
MAVGPISTPLAAARAGTRLLGGALRLATSPARTATSLSFGAAEAVLDLLERGSSQQPGTPYGKPRLRDVSPGVARRRKGDGTAVLAIRPSIARAPSHKRRASTPGIPAGAERRSAPPR